MLTESQKEYMQGIPEDAPSKVRPWDQAAATYAEALVAEIETVSGLEVFWEGSLALGIPGENDIDLYIFAEPDQFAEFLPRVTQVLGEPTYVLGDKILWRTQKDGHKVDAGLISRSSIDAQRDTFFFDALKRDEKLLQEYAAIKDPSLSAREYYRQKNEFYNRVTEGFTA